MESKAIGRSLVGLFALVSLASTGCATVHPEAKTTYFGAVDPKRDRLTAASANEKAMTDDDASVEIVRGSVPEGLVVADGGKKLVVSEGYEQRFTVLGEVTADYDAARRALVVNNVFGAWDHEEGWRDGLCKAQVPLKIVTLGLWAYASPTHYPCFARLPQDEGDRTEALLVRLRHGARAMGANLVVVTGEHGAVVVDARNGVRLGPEVSALGLTGFAVRRR